MINYTNNVFEKLDPEKRFEMRYFYDPKLDHFPLNFSEHCSSSPVAPSPVLQNRLSEFLFSAKQLV